MTWGGFLETSVTLMLRDTTGRNIPVDFGVNDHISSDTLDGKEVTDDWDARIIWTDGDSLLVNG